MVTVLLSHQIDEAKGGCQICGIDSGSIWKSQVVCTGPLNLKGQAVEAKSDKSLIHRISEDLSMPPPPEPLPWPIQWSQQPIEPEFFNTNGTGPSTLLPPGLGFPQPQPPPPAVPKETIRKIAPLPPRIVD
jgi:hypothetical protein